MAPNLQILNEKLINNFINQKLYTYNEIFKKTNNQGHSISHISLHNSNNSLDFIRVILKEKR